jgi:hypothetical protein
MAGYAFGSNPPCEFSSRSGNRQDIVSMMDGGLSGGLFPRRFLFAGLKPECPPGESRDVKIALREDTLEFQDRLQAVRIGL